MPKKKLIAGNWKMHLTVPDALQFFDSLKKHPLPSEVDILIAPPFTLLGALSESVQETGILLGGQNMYFEERGAFTGEISAGMLLDAGCSHVLIGHSERRQLFGETDQLVSRKLVAALKTGLHPILCVGETQAERNANQTEAIITRQLDSALANLESPSISQITLAYEPVWAIGTGHHATPDQAQRVHQFIREWVQKQQGPGPAASVRILYGGSVTAENASSLLTQPDIDGVLVGSASLDAESFYAIISAVK